MLEIVAIACKASAAGDVHPIDILDGLAIDHPLRQRQPDAAALAEASHHAAGDPVVPEPRHGSDQRITVRREGECTVHPLLDADLLKAGEALEALGELRHDAVDIFRDQLRAVVPGRPLDVPVSRIEFVDPEEYALTLLSQISEAFEVDG